jgi:hypothetical protein
LDLLDALTSRVTVFTFDQIARTWWAGTNPRAAKKRLLKLQEGGFVERAKVNVLPIPPLPGPIVAWSPGDPPPPFEKVAWSLQKRWAKAAKPTPIVTATKFSANLFGTFAGPLTDVVAASHDCCHSEVYLIYRRERPDEARLWRSELALTNRKAGLFTKDPDAVLLDAERQVVKVVENGGKYDASRVRAFHFFCEAKAVRYEIW